MDDDDVWELAHEEDLWIFDKLILSKRLGYQCGPVGGWALSLRNILLDHV